MSRNFRGILTRVVPRWLKGPNAQSILYTIGACTDAIGETLLAGLYARLPGHSAGTSEALPYLGRDKGITRGPSETDAAYALRVSKALDSWSTAGNVYTLIAQLREWWAPYYRPFRIVTNSGVWYDVAPDGTVTKTATSPNNWNWDGHPERWFRFWIIFAAAPFVRWMIGDGHRIGMSGLTIGSTMPSFWYAGIRSIVDRWKPAGTICESIIATFDDSIFLSSNAAGSPGQPDGTYDDPASRNGSAIYSASVI